MAEIIANEGGGKKKHGKQRAKKHSTHIDMTPMVDLMSLLITFFMLTTAFSKPKVMEIVLPQKDKGKQDTSKGPEIPKWRTYHILLTGNDKVYWYNGQQMQEKNAPEFQIIESNYSKDGIRAFLLEKNFNLYARIDTLNLKVLKGELKIKQDSVQKIIKKYRNEDSKGPIVLIKADERTKYKNIVDIIDEMAIANIARYAIVDLNQYEKKFLDEKNGVVAEDNKIK